MFEREISNLKRNLSSKVDLAQRFIYLKDILKIPELNWAYKAYFNAEIDWLIYREQMARIEHLNFDYSSPAFEDIFEMLDPLLKKYARYERKDFINAIQSAIKTRLNYLIRPRTALKWFIFRGEPTRTLFEVKLRLNYFADYSYLLDGFKKWLEECNFTNDNDLISVLEFEKAIETIDNDNVFDLSPEQFSDLLAPLFELFAEANEEGELTVPIEALIIFFDDKQVHPVVAELEKVLDGNEKFYFDKYDLIEFIYKLINQFEIPTEPAANTEVAQTETNNFPDFSLGVKNILGNQPSFNTDEELEPLEEDSQDFNLQFDASKISGMGFSPLENNDCESEINILTTEVEDNLELATPTEEEYSFEDVSSLEDAFEVETTEEHAFNEEETLSEQIVEINVLETDSSAELEEASEQDIANLMGNIEENIESIPEMAEFEQEIEQNMQDVNNEFGAIIDNYNEEVVDDGIIENLENSIESDTPISAISAEEFMNKEAAQENQENAMNSTQADEMMGNLRKLLVALREIMDTEKK